VSANDVEMVDEGHGSQASFRIVKHHLAATTWSPVVLEPGTSELPKATAGQQVTFKISAKDVCGNARTLVGDSPSV
jgi:hypothetical protein